MTYPKTIFLLWAAFSLATRSLATDECLLVNKQLAPGSQESVVTLTVEELDRLSPDQLQAYAGRQIKVTGKTQELFGIYATGPQRLLAEKSLELSEQELVKDLLRVSGEANYSDQVESPDTLARDFARKGSEHAKAIADKITSALDIPAVSGGREKAVAVLADCVIEQMMEMELVAFGLRFTAALGASAVAKAIAAERPQYLKSAEGFSYATVDRQLAEKLLRTVNQKGGAIPPNEHNLSHVAKYRQAHEETRRLKATPASANSARGHADRQWPVPVYFEKRQTLPHEKVVRGASSQ